MISSTNFVFISRQILLADHHRNRMRTGTDMLGATVSSLQHISRESTKMGQGMSNIVITSPNLGTAPPPLIWRPGSATEFKSAFIKFTDIYADLWSLYTWLHVCFPLRFIFSDMLQEWCATRSQINLKQKTMELERKVSPTLVIFSLIFNAVTW